jgi:hypothetical protein
MPTLLMTRGARGRVFLGSVFLLAGAACGGSTDAGPIAARDFPTTYAAAFCANLEACCRRFAFGYDEASCRNIIAGMMQMRLNQATGGGVTYDPAKARVCVDTAAGYARTCTPSAEQEAALNRACSVAFGNEQGSQGTIVSSGSGWRDDQTGIFYSVNVCEGGSGAAGAGTLKPGDPCSCPSDCLAPSGGAARCIEWTTTSADGTTQSGSLCQATEPAADGDPCGASSDSPSSLPSTVGQFETARRPVVTECSTQTGMFFCDYSGCGPGNPCDPSQGGVCRHLPNAGEPCAGGYQCARGLTCVRGKCGAPAPTGAPCVSGDECGSEASCGRGICVPHRIAANQESCGAVPLRSNGGSSTGIAGPACPPGATMGCTCTDGSPGTSICEGSGFGPCTCAGAGGAQAAGGAANIGGAGPASSGSSTGASFGAGGGP